MNFKERGFIDCTITPTIAFDDDNRTVSAVMEITEGPRYRWGNVQVIGLDPKTETALRARLPKDSIVNPKLIRDFYQEYKSSLPVDASPETVVWKRDRQRAVVDITFDFSTPPHNQFTIENSGRKHMMSGKATQELAATAR